MDLWKSWLDGMCSGWEFKIFWSPLKEYNNLTEWIIYASYILTLLEWNIPIRPSSYTTVPWCCQWWNKSEWSVLIWSDQHYLGVLLYYIIFVQCLWMAPASKGALLNIHYYYYYQCDSQEWLGIDQLLLDSQPI